MAFDRKEFLDTISERAQERNAAMMPALRQLQAVAPVMQSLLTGSDAWDRYLTYLQGYIEQAEDAKARAQSKITSPEAADPMVLAKLRVDILTAESMVEAWEAAINLPHVLISGASEAAKTIAKIGEEKNGSTGQAQS